MNFLSNLKHAANLALVGIGDAIGDTENVVHFPLYPIRYYVSEVVPGVLYRGAWPTVARLRKLKAMGVRTIVNLCEERFDSCQTRDAGLQWSSFPMEDNGIPKAWQPEAFLSILKQPLLTPAYVHCEAGSGRTGCMVAAYRVMVQGWTPERALEEAEEFGLAMPNQKAWILGLKRAA